MDNSIRFNCITSDIYKTGVYTIKHINKPNIYYVGSTSRYKCKYSSGNGFYKRWVEHVRKLKNNTHDSKYLQNVVNKYGIEGLEFEVLDIYEPDLCLSAEQYWINMLNSCNRLYGYNTNSVVGSMLGFKHSKKSKIKMSITKETLLKKYYTIVIELYNKNMTLEDISNQINFNKRTISKILKINNIPIKTKGSRSRKSILQYDVNNNFIKEWSSAQEIEIELGFLNSHINSVCNNKRKTAYKYKWRFKNGKQYNSN